MGSRLGDEAVELLPPRDRTPDDHSDRELFSSTSRLLRQHNQTTSSSPTPPLGHSQDSQRRETRRAPKFSGWRVGAIASASVASLICLLNLFIMIWVVATYPRSNGIATVFTGSCQTVNDISLGTHVVINILSSILLGASNYCMQCLVAPTRSECDRAHQRDSWLDIGVNSVQNLFKISPARTITWLLLASTSIPIHLVYNSAVFKVLASNAFNVLVVNEEFLSSGSASFRTPTAWPIENGNCRFMEGETQVKSYNCSIDCGIRTSGSQIAQNMTFDNFADGVEVIYSNGTSQVFYLDDTKVRSWSTLSNCHVVNCTIGIPGAVLDKPSMADYLDWCSYKPRPPSWRSNATAAKEHFLRNPYERLSLERCISVYGHDFVSEWNHVFFVTKEAEPAALPAAYHYVDYKQYRINVQYSRQPYDWLCDGHIANCNIAKLQQKLSQFTLGSKLIDYCMAQPVKDGHCEIQFSTTILAVVIVCNAMKASLMLLTVFRQQERPLMVIGDAIASYLHRPDQASSGHCLITGQAARRRQLPSHNPTGLRSATWSCQQYDTPTRRWFQNVAVSQLVLTISLAIACVTATVVLLVLALQSVRYAFGAAQSPWELGFGTAYSGLRVDYGQSITMTPSSFVSSVLVANLPQLIISFVYLIYNGVLTAMAEGKEWSGYARRPKSLRVTNPSGTQRSSYVLSLPYRFGLPLLVASTTLHWLISSSLFLVRVDSYFDGVKDGDKGFSFAGFSPLPILLALLLGVLMLVAGCAMGLLPLDGTMPLVSSNSFAIAAACHPPTADTDAATLPVHWGEVEMPGSKEIGHCTFTSFDTRPPTTGKYYR